MCYHYFSVKLFAAQSQDKPEKSKMYQYEGVWFADTNVDRDILLRLPKWEARSNDAYVVSYPKAGKPISMISINNSIE